MFTLILIAVQNIIDRVKRIAQVSNDRIMVNNLWYVHGMGSNFREDE